MPKPKKKISKTKSIEDTIGKENIKSKELKKPPESNIPKQRPFSQPKFKEGRIKTGIPGIDDITNGGFIPGNLVLVTGTTGTGKTIFSSQFIYNGATKYKEKGVYISLEEPDENIKRNALNFGWDFEKLEKDGMVKFVRFDPYHAEDVYDLIENTIKEMGATRVVVDSISSLGLYVRDTPELRRMIFNISLLLRKLGCTAILTSEIPPNQNSLSRFGVEEFVTDGIVVFYYSRVDAQFSRSTTIWKMRGTDHSHKMHPYNIESKKGIIVYPKEEAFVKM